MAPFCVSMTSKKPGFSEGRRGPLLGVESICQEPVRVALDLLDQICVSWLDEANASLHRVSVGQGCPMNDRPAVHF
jgi:hypothetical protein